MPSPTWWGAMVVFEQGKDSDVEAGDKARQAGGGRLGAMMYVWLWG